jgi:TolB-like protein
LPFQNLSPNGEDVYFTVGMRDEITSDLARLAGLKVVGSQSRRSYVPSKQRNLRAIGHDLRVRYLLEGDVRRANSEMRVSLRLVDLRDSDHPWIKTYQRPMKDAFAVQLFRQRDPKFMLAHLELTKAYDTLYQLGMRRQL